MKEPKVGNTPATIVPKKTNTAIPLLKYLT
jgi:hypothetical protein